MKNKFNPNEIDTILSISGTGVWECDLETQEVLCNPVYYSMLGYDPEDFSNEHGSFHEKVSNLMDDEERGSFMVRLRSYLDEHRQDIMEDVFRLRKKDGSWLWVANRIKRIEKDGKQFIIGTLTDMTEKKEKEKALEHFNDLMRYIIEHDTSDIAVHDKDLRYLYVSQSYLDRYRVQDQDVIGKHHYKVFPDLPQKWRDVHQRALNGEVLSAKEDPFYREDGSVDWTRWECRPWYDQAGSIGGIVIYTEVINEQKEMEQLIIKEKEQFKTTLLSVGDAVLSTDATGRINVMNPVAEKLTGWSFEEAEGRLYHEILQLENEDSGELLDCLVEKVLSQEKTLTLDENTQLIAKDGTKIPVEDSAAPIMDECGNVMGVVVVFRDYTEKREKARQIEYLSYRDHLTGLYNRRYMESLFKKYDVSSYWPLSVMMVDVNGLKLTNDAFGHAMGDRLLQLVTDILLEVSAPNYAVGRMGGDEFCILMPNTTKKDAEIVKHAIISVADRSSLESLIISLALGSATKKDQDVNLQHVLTMADNNMYKDKLKYGKIMRSQTIETVLRNINEKYD